MPDYPRGTMDRQGNYPDEIEFDPNDMPFDAEVRERLGKIVRATWIVWALEQPDIAEHTHWLTKWEDLAERDKEVDRRIGEAIARDVFQNIGGGNG